MAILDCETAWKAIPKSAVQSQLDNSFILQQKGASKARTDTAYQQNFNDTELAQRAKTIANASITEAIPG